MFIYYSGGFTHDWNNILYYIDIKLLYYKIFGYDEKYQIYLYPIIDR